MGNCNVVRKLVEGEGFTVLEGPNVDTDSGISRVKGKTLKDEKEGWITVKGNAGTVYAALSSKHWTILEDTPLQKEASLSSEEVRTLTKGEAVTALDKPREEQRPPVVRAKCRAVSDSSVGWITVRSQCVRGWSVFYKCLVAAPMTDSSVVSADGKEIRQINAGEIVELLDGPTADGNEIRMKGRAEKDGVIGWVSVKDSDGKRFFEA